MTWKQLATTSGSGSLPRRLAALQKARREEERGRPWRPVGDAPRRSKVGLRPVPLFREAGAVAALLAGMLGLPAQAQVLIEPIGTTLDATWQGGVGNAPFN